MKRILLLLVAVLFISGTALGQSAGDILITELMPDPSDVTDTNGEYFELYNLTNSNIDINGFIISDHNSSHTIVSSVVVPSKGFIVMGRNSDSGTNGGVTIAYQYSSGISLVQSNGAISLSTSGSSVITSVSYTSSTIGVAMELSNLSDASSGVISEGDLIAATSAVDGSGSDLGSPGSQGNTVLDATIISGDAGWRLLSFPIENPTVETISDDTPVQGIAGGDNESATDASFYQNLGAADANQGTGYTEPATVSTVLDEGLGFALYFFNNGTAGSSSLPITLDASGSEPSSTVEVTLSSLYTLVGNPFASNIALTSVVGNDSEAGVQDGLTGTAQLYDDATGNFIGVNYSSGILAPWQGFFVERNSSATTRIDFPIAAKTTTATTNEEFSKVAVNNIRQIELKMEAPEGYGDMGRLYFTDTSNDGMDPFDSKKFSSLSGAPSFAFMIEDELLFQDARSNQITEAKIFKVDLSDAGISGDYKFTWAVMDNIPDDWTITLKDLSNGVEKDLRIDSSYEFKVETKQKRRNISALQTPNIRLKSASGVERFEISITPNTNSVNNEGEDRVSRFALAQNYPNPFNPTTTINYSVENSGAVTLSVYNLMGQKVAELVNETKSAGSYNVTWNASQAASGMYYYRLEAGGQVLTRKMTLIK